MKLGSINVRGLGNRFKRPEMFNWLQDKKYSIHFTVVKKPIVLKKVCTTGKLNGAIKPYSVAVLVKRLVLQCYSIITLIFKQ